MSDDGQDFSDLVELAIKTALLPLLERLAVAESKVLELSGVEPALSGLRERLAIAETKAAALSTPSAAAGEPHGDLARRIDALEQRPLTPLSAEDATAFRERLVVVETKCCGISVGPDASVEQRLLSAMERLSTLEYALSRAESHEAMIAELKARLAAAEATASQYAELAATARQLIERVTVIETKSAVPGVAEPLLNGLTHRLQALETRVIEDPAMKECASIRERVAVVEMRASVPGPAGAAGKDGHDGSDGLGFEDMDVQFDGDRTITIKAERGSRKKSWPIVLPFQRQKGVYVEGATYVEGDLVTWGGSQWHANEETAAKPGEGSKAWTLVVKRGRDGKDGKDAAAPLPVVRVGG